MVSVQHVDEVTNVSWTLLNELYRCMNCGADLQQHVMVK